MATSVLLAARTTFLLMALRQMVKEAPEARIAAEVQDAAEAATALAGRLIDIAIIDTGLLDGQTDSALLSILKRRSAPTLLINASGGTQQKVQSLGTVAWLAPSVPDGSVNLGAIKAQLLPALRRLVEEWRIVATSLPREERPDTTPDKVAQTRPSGRGLEVVLIGASTGGPDALLVILKGLKDLALPIVIAQHMPSDQTTSFAHHLSEATGFDVVERGTGIVPADRSITILRGGEDYRIRRCQDEGFLLRHAYVADNPFHPSVDMLFGSAAEAGLAAAAVLLTGMGNDGAEGALALRRKGWPVVVQTRESSVVPGMPNAAIEAGAASEVLGLARIAERIQTWMQTGLAEGRA